MEQRCIFFISIYGDLRQLARTLGHDDVANILEETLNEVKEAGMLLTDVAENRGNYKASEGKEK